MLPYSFPAVQAIFGTVQSYLPLHFVHLSTCHGFSCFDPIAHSGQPFIVQPWCVTAITPPIPGKSRSHLCSRDLKKKTSLQHSDSDSETQIRFFNMCAPQPTISLPLFLSPQICLVWTGTICTASAWSAFLALLSTHTFPDLLCSTGARRDVSGCSTIPPTPSTRSFHRGSHNFLTDNLLDLLYSTRRHCHDRGRSTSPPPLVR